MRYLIGVDEAGRGPLAGPVAVGVAKVPGNFDWASKLPGVTDSKKLSPEKRESLFRLCRELKRAGELDFSVAMVGPKAIDARGISTAVAIGMKRALDRLALDPADCYVRLDGLLQAPNIYPQETIVGGDGREPVIGLASILAKVTRDRYMVRLAKKSEYAGYDFSAHKGYGTKAHRASIVQHGLSPAHRRSYCQNLPGVYYE